MTSKLRQYPYDLSGDMWVHVKPHIQRALDRGSIYTADEILVGILQDKMQLWTWADSEDETDIQAAMVTT